MIDFMVISTRSTKRGVIEIYPKFIIKKSTDLMIRGGDFYAIWIEERGLWSTDEQDALQLIDRELDKYAEENRKNFDYTDTTAEPLRAVEGITTHALTIAPILTNGDITGAVAFMATDDTELCTDKQSMLAKAAAMFLGKQIEE